MDYNQEKQMWIEFNELPLYTKVGITCIVSEIMDIFTEVEK